MDDKLGGFRPNDSSPRRSRPRSAAEGPASDQGGSRRVEARVVVVSESWATSENARRSMQANRSRDTGPELAVRRLVHAAGLRYRVDVRPVPTLRCKADLVFTRAKVAVFVDGCFWHGCEEHFTHPKANADYWEQKINRNKSRDAASTRALDEQGWTVLRYWEHQPAAEVAKAIKAALAATLALRPSRPVACHGAL